MLITIALTLVLNLPSPVANGSESPAPKPNSPASPSARYKEKQNKPDSHAQEAQSSPSPSSETTIIVRDPPTETKKDSPKTEPQNTVPRGPQEGWNWGSVPDWGLVIVGIITACLALRSLSDIATQAKASVKAADAATAGAVAARDSADIAKLSMVASERAYVHFNGCRWISHPEDGRIFWRIRASWINSGNTPTRGLHIYVHLDSRDDEIPQDYRFVPDPTVKPIPATISPKGIVESGCWDITGMDLVTVSKGNKHLYIWGRAVYRDVFPETKDHVTKFCVVATNLTGDPLSPWHAERNPFDIAFAVYPRHNCADEDCDHDS